MLSFIVTQLLVATNTFIGIPAGINDQVITYDNYVSHGQTLKTNSYAYQIISIRDEMSVEVKPQHVGTASVSISIPNSGIIDTAMSLRGIPYVTNASDPSVGFDCSGFVMFVYAQHGVLLPHSSTAQGNLGNVISESEAVPGDLLIWPGHVAIYVSPGMMIDSAVPGTVVDVRPIWGSPEYVRL